MTANTQPTDPHESDSEPLSFRDFVADLSRRGFLKGSAVAGVGLAGLGTAGTGTVAADDHGDMTIPEILNYALTLERLEATYYDVAVGDDGIWSESEVENSPVAEQFAEPSLRYSVYNHIVDVADHEAYHVTLIEQVLDQLGADVTAPEEFTFPDGVYADLESFVDYARTVENVGVSAYAGVAPMLAKAELATVDGDTSQLQVTPAALGIHSIEARHAAYFSTLTERRPWPAGPDVEVSDAAVDDPRSPSEVTEIVGPLLGGPEEEGPATVTFEDQMAHGHTVEVASTFLPKGGFVVIHDDRLLDGKALESVVGASRYLRPGTTNEVRVRVAREGGFSGEQTLIAMAHMDTNDNREYDFSETGGSADGPYVDPEDTNGDGTDVVVDPATVEF